MVDVNFVTTSPDEQETLINIDYVSKRAHVYTSRAFTARQLAKLCEDHPDEAQIETNNNFGLSIEVPMEWINIRPKFKRHMTDEQKQAISERLLEARRQKK